MWLSEMVNGKLRDSKFSDSLFEQTSEAGSEAGSGQKHLLIKARGKTFMRMGGTTTKEII